MAKEVCVVVGAGPGVGLAAARRFGQGGYNVALVARQAQALEGYVAELKQAGTEASSFAADAGDFESLNKAFAAIQEQAGDVGVLIYNTALLKQGTPSQLDPQELMSSFAVNVAGALVSVQAVLPGMRNRKQGTILFTGGGLALNPAAPYAALAIGKASIRSLAYSMGQELEPEGIHVATVTIAGFVQPGTHFDPDKIAEVYWQLHNQPAGQWEREIVYR